jgi:hypothetical protein
MEETGRGKKGEGETRRGGDKETGRQRDWETKRLGEGERTKRD